MGEGREGGERREGERLGFRVVQGVGLLRV